MNDSYWINKQKQQLQFPQVTKELDTNIVIIGGGLCGLSSAYYLSKAKEDIIVLEAEEIGRGASGRNTGKVTSHHGLIYRHLLESYDKHFARLYYHANEEAITSIEEIIQEHGIDCDFHRCDTMLYTNDDVQIAQLQDEYQVYLDLHIPCTYVEKQTTPFAMKAGLIMHYQAVYDPYAYACGLAKVLRDAGVSLYEHSPVSDLQEEADGSYTLLCNNQRIHAKKVILATQFPILDHGHFYFARMRCDQETILLCDYHGEDCTALSIDTPMRSWNSIRDGILIGGNSGKSGQQDSSDLQEMLKEVAQSSSIGDVKAGWSNSDYISFDHIPFIGKLDKHNENLLFASGFSKWGNTSANIAGKLLCAHALGKRSQYRVIFTPQRMSDIFSLPFVKENLNVAYEFIKGKFKHPDDQYPDIGEGKLVQIDDHTYGVYRDEEEILHIVDVTCPHLGCVCHFNAMDKTWDCPCHGSRFSYTGELIKGPATYRLHRYGEGFNEIDPHIID